MTGRPSARSLVLVALVLAAAAAGCGGEGTPRRVPDDGAPCSAIMPGAATSGEKSIRLESVAVTERSWVLRPPDVSGNTPRDIDLYVVRRGSVPAGSALRDAALLDAAAARAARGIALQDGTKPSVAKMATRAGEAVELRWATGKLHNATRFLLIPGGYCEVTILGARADSDVTSYLASVQARPDGKD
jgi:hypothetical protein